MKEIEEIFKDALKTKPWDLEPEFFKTIVALTSERLEYKANIAQVIAYLIV